MKSKVFSLHVQACSISSSSKRQFAGTLFLLAHGPYCEWRACHVGCVGAMSIPTTSAEGNSSATSIHHIPTSVKSIYDLLKSLAYQSRIQDPEFSEGWLEWVLGSASCSEAHSISRGTCRCGPIQAHPSGSHILKGKMSTNFDFSWLFCVPSFP